MTNKNRTHSTREKTSRKIVYTPPNNLDAPDPKVDGIKYRWIRVSSGGEDDSQNISKKRREGYEFVRAEEHPEFDAPKHESGKYAGVIGTGDLVLAKIPTETVNERNEHYKHRNVQQNEALDNTMFNEVQGNNRYVKYYSNRKSNVSFGKKR